MAGRRTRMTWPDAFYVTYAYDNANDLTGILENGSTSLAAYTYDNLGRETLLTRDGSSNATETPAYDNASNLSQLVQNQHHIRSNDRLGPVSGWGVLASIVTSGLIA